MCILTMQPVNDRILSSSAVDDIEPEQDSYLRSSSAHSSLCVLNVLTLVTSSSDIEL